MITTVNLLIDQCSRPWAVSTNRHGIQTLGGRLAADAHVGIHDEGDIARGRINTEGEQQQQQRHNNREVKVKTCDQPSASLPNW